MLELMVIQEPLLIGGFPAFLVVPSDG